MENKNQTFQCSKCNIICSFDNKASGKYDKRCKNCLKQAKNLSNNIQPRAKDLNETNLESREWQGGKYTGTIFERNNGQYIVLGINLPHLQNTKQINFAVSKYKGNVEDAKQAAIQEKINLNKQYNLIRNQYKIIKNSNNNQLLIIVQLTKGYVTLCDIDQLDSIKNHWLYITKGGSQNAQHYAMIDDQGNKRFHGFITGFDMVDHYNGYPLDNRLENLSKTNPSLNNINHTRITGGINVTKNLNNIYTVKIVYTDPVALHFGQTTVQQDFSSHTDAWKWARNKELEIDNETLNQKKKKLLTEFETIMNEHAQGFKWQDKYHDLTEDVDQLVNQTQNLSIQPKSKAEQNAIIYHKFNEQISQDYIIPQKLLEEGGRGINIIEYDGIKYKFCNTCENWTQTQQYGSCKSHSDGLASACKECDRKKRENQKSKTKNNKQKQPQYL